MISIITPAYNAEKYISQTIESVLNQTYTEWEMVIVDDCSVDNTYNIILEYAKRDNRIKPVKHEVNKGVAEARNTALRESSGDFVAFLDSDDLWVPEKLRIQLDFMEKNNYVLTYTMYQNFFDNGEKGKIISVPEKMTYKDIFKNTAIACLTVMVNRKVSGEFFMPPLKHTEDQCAWQDILKRGYIAYGLNENLALYRVNSNSLTGNKKKVIKRQWSTYRDYYKFSFLKSAYYFICYAFNAIKKHI